MLADGAFQATERACHPLWTHLCLVHTADTRHRQDKTVLSCLVGGVNWVRDSRRQFSICWRQNSFVQSCLRCERICELTSLPNMTSHRYRELETGSGQDKTRFTLHFETGRNCFEIFSRRRSPTVLTCRQFSLHREHRQEKTRQCCSVSAVWTSH